MILDAKILNTITSITFSENKTPQVYISMSYAIEENMVDYGFVSGFGVKWLAQILYVFDIDCLEKVYDEKLIIEIDDDEKIVRVGSKKTGTYFGELKDREGNSGEVPMVDFERFEIGRWKK